MGNPDWPTLAAAFGGTGVIATTPSAIRHEVRRARSEGGLQVIAIPIDERHYANQM